MRHLNTLLIGLSALALAVIPALAGSGSITDDTVGVVDFHGAMQVTLLSFGTLFLLASVLASTFRGRYVPRLLTVLVLASVALAALHFPVLAQVAGTSDGKVLGTTGGATVVTLPYGEYVAGLQAGLTTLLTVVATAVLAYLPIPLRWVINLYGVDKLVKDVVGFAVAATPGASRDAKLDINVGSQVLARALNKAIADGSPRLIKAAGNLEGLQSKIIAMMNLEPQVTAQELIRAVPTPAKQG